MPATEAPPAPPPPAPPAAPPAPPAPAPAAPAAPAGAEKKEPGEVGVSVFAERFTGKRKAAAPPAEPTPAPAGAASPAEPPKPAKPSVKPKAAPAPAPVIPALDNLEDKIAEGIAKGIAATQPKAPPPKDEFTPEQQETIEVLKAMEKDYPDEAGKAEAFAEATRKANTYREQWEKEHPDQTFDPEDDEHNEFFENNAVDWDDHRYNRVLAHMEAERIIAKRDDKTSRKLAEIEQRERLRESAPIIEAKQAQSAKAFFKELGDEYKEVLDERGAINHAEVKRLYESDPVKGIAFQAAQSVEVFTGELHRLVDKLVDFQQGNPLHEAIWNFVREEENLMRSLPSEQTVFQGRQFVTADEYEKLPPEKRSRYWHYTVNDLARIRAEREAENVRLAIAAEEERLANIAKARGWTGVVPKSSASAPTVQAAPPSSPPAPKPNSPAVTMAPRSAPQGAGGAAGANSGTSSFLTRFRG